MRAGEVIPLGVGSRRAQKNNCVTSQAPAPNVSISVGLIAICSIKERRGVRRLCRRARVQKCTDAKAWCAGRHTSLDLGKNGEGR
jgi:hypothetical protein